jgi:hypothetical protein
MSFSISQSTTAKQRAADEPILRRMFRQFEPAQHLQ